MLTGFNILSPKTKIRCVAPPRLRWACLARQGGNFNRDNSTRSKVQVPLAGPETLESLSFFGGLQQSSLF